MYKSVIELDEFKAGPPENHGYYKTWMDKTDHHHWQNGHPNWWEWFDGWRGGADRSFIGEATLEEVREALMAASNNILESQHDVRLDYKAWEAP